MIHLKKSRKGCGRDPVAAPLPALSAPHWPAYTTRRRRAGHMRCYAAFDAVVLDGRRDPRDRRWQSKRRRIQRRQIM